MLKKMFFLCNKTRLITLASSLMVTCALPAMAKDSLTLYTTREPA